MTFLILRFSLLPFILPLFLGPGVIQGHYYYGINLRHSLRRFRCQCLYKRPCNPCVIKGYLWIDPYSNSGLPCSSAKNVIFAPKFTLPHFSIKQAMPCSMIQRRIFWLIIKLWKMSYHFFYNAALQKHKTSGNIFHFQQKLF